MNLKRIKFILIILLVIIFSISACMVGVLIKAQNNKEGILENKIIYIDPGHGGKDDGASVDKVMEDEINLKISGYLYEKLISLGAYVLISRTSDYDLASLYQKNRKREDLKKRVDYINSSKPDIFISIHLNAYPSNNVSGAQVFYKNDDNSKRLSEIIQNQLNVFTNKTRKNKLGDYYILNKTNPVGVLVECGFLSNNEERVKLNNKDYQMKIADKIKNGIVEYFLEK